MIPNISNFLSLIFSYRNSLYGRWGEFSLIWHIGWPTKYTQYLQALTEVWHRQEIVQTSSMLSGCWGGTYSSPLLYPVSSYSVEAWYSLEVTVAEACMRCFRACVRWGEERCLLLLFTLSWPSKVPPGSWLASFSSLAVDGTQRVGEFRERVAFSWRASVVAWWCWWECDACPPWCSLDSHSVFDVVGFFFGRIVIVNCVSTDDPCC